MSRFERRAAFTLLEVLAAVAILGVLYVVLARVAIEGLRAEGESERLLAASLLADLRLADLEAALAAGGPPPLGVTESEEGDYLVAISVTPFALPVPVPEAAEAGAPPALPSAGGDPEESPIRAVEVTVSWSEGFEEQRVTRTTWAFDAGAALERAAAEASP